MGARCFNLGVDTYKLHACHLLFALYDLIKQKQKAETKRISGVLHETKPERERERKVVWLEREREREWRAPSDDHQ